jgi:predicted DNA-binding transcriptional regulator
VSEAEIANLTLKVHFGSPWSVDHYDDVPPVNVQEPMILRAELYVVLRDHARFAHIESEVAHERCALFHVTELTGLRSREASRWVGIAAHTISPFEPFQAIAAKVRE